ncbi:MAG: DUF4145 domain-containing protein [Rhodobacteraceae bacterium]|nr:DUF4145 domain-containing protein [Paracoccaceae bacterium]
MAFTPFNWMCPHCGIMQTVTDPVFDFTSFHLNVRDSADGSFGIFLRSTVCVNPECGKLTVEASIREDLTVRPFNGGLRHSSKKDGITLFSGRLIPESEAKPQPECIPAPLREDYYEACRIRDLSAKASATLSRRCLQGMIRDFCGVRKETLAKEVMALKALVDSEKGPKGVSIESVDAIDYVRGIGNIGAHMEKDINHIVPVDTQEAQRLIGLIESLFEDWYVAREKRQARFSGIRAVAEEKKALIAAKKAQLIEGPKES